MSKDIKLQKYIKREVVEAIRITKSNFQALRENDGDGCLETDDVNDVNNPDDYIGDWLVQERSSGGGQLVRNDDFKKNYKKLDK